MPEEPRRQLAAIMFADMVGFTALMQADEDQARAKRDRQREVFTRLVGEHQGEILQYFGDGTLTIFPSAVEAVRCAVAFQVELREAPVVEMRIGIHTGDVVQDDSGVYGDGVNVAARIEALAPAGGIMISGKVFDEIKNHPTLSAESFGPVQLKNVAHPVTVFGISSDGMTLPSKGEIQARTALAKAQASLEGQGGGPPSGEVPGPGESFLQKVRERALLQWALVYLLGAWAFLQAGGFMAEELRWSSRVERGLEVLTFVGFFITLVVAWYHGERGKQPVRAREVGIIGFLLLLGIGSLFSVHTGPESAESGITPPALPASDSRPSIAVLPFDNFSPDPADAYFPAGVQEDITTALSRIRSLRVPARSSVTRYREQRPSSQAMAAALGVDYLLEGSATVVGGTARVTVQLIHGPTDQHIWAENYDHQFSVEEVIAVRSAVAREVATRLRAIMTPEEEARIAEHPTEDPRALELYQRARFRWNQRTESAVREALGLFQEAIDLDPGFAQAYAGLADAYLVLSNRGWMDHREGHPRGIAAAERAMELDSLNGSAAASLGALHLWSTRVWDRSEEYFLRAIRLDHEYAYTHYWYSALLSALGRHEEAIHQALEAEQLDPLSPQIASGPARSYFLARRYSEAIESASTALTLHAEYPPLHAQLCRCHLVQGEMEEALEACRREKELSGARGSMSTALVFAYQGDRARAMAEVADLPGSEEGQAPQPIIMAMVHAALGEEEEAFSELLNALNEDFPYLEYLPSNPFFDPLREDARFQALLEELNLNASSPSPGQPTL